VALSSIALAVACGGATAPIPDPGASSGSAGSSGGSSGGGSSGGASSGGARSCTEIGCANGFDIQFSYNTPGSYIVDVKLDGDLVHCAATIPLRGSGTPCDRSDVLLTTVGSALPVAQQSIGGVHLTNTSAKRVSIQVQRDGKMLASGSWDPIPYVTRPGPNGPGCPPETCTSGSVVLTER
jgi:hypothetical protein